MSDSDIDLFVDAVLGTFDELAVSKDCPHGVSDDFICDVCEGLTPAADVVPFRSVRLSLKIGDGQ